MPDYIDPAWEYREDNLELMEVMGVAATRWDRLSPDGKKLNSIGMRITSSPSWDNTKQSPEPKPDNAIRCSNCKRSFIPRDSSNTLRFCTRWCSNQYRRKSEDEKAKLTHMFEELYRVYGSVTAVSVHGKTSHITATRYLRHIPKNGRGPNVGNKPNQKLRRVSIDEAKDMTMAGVRYGDVYPLLPENERQEFKEWWLREPSVPVQRHQTNGKPDTKHSDNPSGDVCTRCGSCNMTRAGTCLLCRDCGDTSGGCG